MYLVMAVFATLTGLMTSVFVVNLMTFQKEVEIRDMSEGKEKSSAKLELRVERILCVFLSMFLMWVLANMLLYAAQASSYKEKQTDATLSDVVSSFGLEPAKEYPVVIGDRTTVSSGRVAYGGLFYIKGSGEWSSSTSILVSFEGDNGSYILEMPISKITFNIQQDATGAFLSIDTPETRQPRSVAYWQYSYTCSDNTWSYGWVKVNCSPAPTRLIVSDDVTRQGLAPVISNAFKGAAGARITLSPSMYNDILGAKTE